MPRGEPGDVPAGVFDLAPRGRGGGSTGEWPDAADHARSHAVRAGFPLRRARFARAGVAAASGRQRRVHRERCEALRFAAMNVHLRLMGAVLAAVALGFLGSKGFGQTPEQEKAWAEDRARATAEAKATQERLARERAARKADPMGWVRTLDPMTNGGWEFRSVASDGSWAVFSTSHQFKRAGQIVTVWMRH